MNFEKAFVVLLLCCTCIYLFLLVSYTSIERPKQLFSLDEENVKNENGQNFGTTITFMEHLGNSTEGFGPKLLQLHNAVTYLFQMSLKYTTLSHESMFSNFIGKPTTKLVTEPINLTSELPIVLIWTAEGWLTRRVNFSEQVESCPVQCLYTTDRRFQSTANATVFHLRDIRWPEDIPTVRHPWQRYVAWHHEAAGWYLGYEISRVPYMFNWSMTYRMDSDIPMPYGMTIGPDQKYQDLDLETSSERINQLLNRSNLIAWATTLCVSHSHRLDYVKRLQQYVKVDVYGNRKCLGKALTCPKVNNTVCLEMMGKKYLFCLAFENSICDGYITEKLWEKMEVFMVPVVLRKKDYEGIVPPYSVIAADDFQGPRELAAYLNYLATNLTAYMEFFQWRLAGYKTCTTILYDYHLDAYPSIYLKNCENVTLGFCRLCQMLHQNAPKKSYESFAEWFMPESTCVQGYSKTISDTKYRRAQEL